VSGAGGAADDFPTWEGDQVSAAAATVLPRVIAPEQRLEMHSRVKP
jgi:hypothetical protein